jgi:hypothetical protein
LPLTNVKDAPVPNTVDIVIATSATLRLVAMAAVHFTREKNSCHQRKEKPDGGKVQNRPSVNERGKTTKIGKTKKSRIRAQIT